MTDLVIRLAEGDDLGAIIAVGRTTYPIAHAGLIDEEVMQLIVDKAWSPEACVPAIRSGRAWVAQMGGDVVGTASYGVTDGKVVLWKLYVLPEHQGKGIGTALFRAVCAALPDDYDEIDIALTDGNQSVRAFCEAHGFTEIGREPQGEGPDLVWMNRPVSSEDRQR